MNASFIYERLRKVAGFRSLSKADSTRKMASHTDLFNCPQVMNCHNQKV